MDLRPNHAAEIALYHALGALLAPNTTHEFFLTRQLFSLGWESFDIVLPQGIWFRCLFQDFIRELKSETSQQLADQLTGYELNGTGELVWGDS
ncbi:MAG: hypothetical protein KZQ82_11115 [Candidatus Thiodiazotropha sp. (ex Lucinoma annulata)]|nr:hypothetical protein [Candidatus Thiodiazotropha sp. (ex Lucinoma annulata)]